MFIALCCFLLLNRILPTFSTPIRNILSTRQYDLDAEIYDTSPDNVFQLPFNDNDDSTTVSQLAGDSSQIPTDIDNAINRNSAVLAEACQPLFGQHSIRDTRHGKTITCNGGRSPGDCKACQNKFRNKCEDLTIACGRDGRGEEACILIAVGYTITLTIDQSHHLLPTNCNPGIAPL